MNEYPVGPISGVLSYLFLQKLCERLERQNILPAGEAKRIWAEILAELQGDTKIASGDCRDAIAYHKLAE
jgi:hypothetical protein